MLIKRILSTLLAVVMLVGVFTIVAGAEDGTTTRPAYTKNTTSAHPTYWYFSGKPAVLNDDTGVYEEKKDAEVMIKTPQNKLQTMDLRFEKGDYRLYVDAYSGEVATERISTGEILFSNPYTLPQSKAKDTVKTNLLSQLIVEFTDTTSGQKTTYDSYTWCASRGQIVVKSIKGGIRVEYSIGREEAKMLVPQLIERSKLEAIISTIEAGYIEAGLENKWAFDKIKIFEGWYKLYDPSEAKSDAEIAKMNISQPITKKGKAVYALDSTATTKEKARIEQAIKTYCPAYSYEQLDEDHMEVEFVAKDENAPLFKMALEYTLDEHGMSVRLPANGIRFNETLYQLENITILPYMGAGMSPNDGYTMYPDGSGALFSFDELYDLGTLTNIAGKVYGNNDFAYHTITGTHQEVIRYPVFGIVENQEFETVVAATESETTDTTTTTGTTAATDATTPETVVVKEDRGFVAIVEEGDALMELATYHPVNTSEYHTVTMKVYPRPKDSYNVSDSISVGSNSTWTVVSARKYTGSYKIRYVMLTDDAVAEEAAKTAADAKFYDCSYVGMAQVYREYLERKGILTRLTAEDVSEDIPLYIETFGAMETMERVLSVPVNVMTPLTTFEDIATMHADLAEKGVKNVNFIMSGYTDGGMTYPAVPYKLKWEKAVQKEMDFEELIEDAKANGYKIFPDFDFVFASTNTLFDGLTLKKHAVKTIDGRYTSKREYSSAKQTYLSYFELALSPAYFSHFYEKLLGEYAEYDINSIAVSTLSNYLNSDFDEDEPYNRADAKDFTEKALAYISERYTDVLSEGGNAYAWKYVDYLTDISLDSSRYSDAAAAIPFLGMVLHGYVELAGTPINMEGNMDYALLKAIENGASMKFILSYRNTENLKEDYILNKYYSIDYAIWEEELVDRYTELNSLLKGVQTSIITDHEFINTATRIPDNDELENDAREAILAAIELEKALKEQAEVDRRESLKLARKLIISISTTEPIANETDAAISGTTAFYVDYLVNTQYPEFKKLVDALKAAKASGESVEEAAAAVVTGLESVYSTISQIISKANRSIANYENAVAGYELIVAEDAYTELIRSELKTLLDSTTEYYEDLLGFVSSANAFASEAYETVIKVDSELEVAPFQLVEVPEEEAEDEETEDEEGTTEGDTTEGETTEGETTEGETTEGDVTVDEETDAEEEEVVTNKYTTDTNKIVYEVYENGTSFILNFNNYSVLVTLPANGVTYAIEPYGYIVVSMAS